MFEYLFDYPNLAAAGVIALVGFSLTCHHLYKNNDNTTKIAKPNNLTNNITNLRKHGSKEESFGEDSTALKNSSETIEKLTNDLYSLNFSENGYENHNLNHQLGIVLNKFIPEVKTILSVLEENVYLCNKSLNKSLCEYFYLHYMQLPGCFSSISFVYIYFVCILGTMLSVYFTKLRYYTKLRHYLEESLLTLKALKKDKFRNW